jgi:hypothetical protein
MRSWYHGKRQQWHAFLMRPQKRGPENARGVRAVLRALWDQWR